MKSLSHYFGVTFTHNSPPKNQSGRCLVYSSIFLFQLRTVTTGFNHWHFFCIIWNGIEGRLALFYDGYADGGFIKRENLKTQVPSGRLFIVNSPDDSDKNHGTITQLNIWDYEISSGNVVAMSAGGFNVHGSVLSWSSLAKYVPDGSIQWKTEIYLPGMLTFGFIGFFMTVKQNRDYLLNFLHALNI